MFKLPLFIPVLGQKVFKRVEICLERLNWIKYYIWKLFHYCENCRGSQNIVRRYVLPALS